MVRHDGEPDSAKATAIHIPPTFRTSYGLRLGMGPITAVREGSAAEKNAIQVRSSQETGDTIFEVEVAEADGKLLRYVSDPGLNPATDATVEVLDPTCLPDQLRQWANRRGIGPKTVKLKVKRKAGHNERGEDVPMELAWDDSSRDNAGAAQ